MITTIGIGKAGSNIAGQFKDSKEYKVYRLSGEFSKSSKFEYKLKSFDKQEDYEENIPVDDAISGAEETKARLEADLVDVEAELAQYIAIRDAE